MSHVSLPRRAASGAALVGLLAALGGAVSTAHADDKVEPAHPNVSKAHVQTRCHFSRSAVCWMTEHRHE